MAVDATSVAGGLRGTRARSTSTTSRRRSASPPTAGCGWRPAPPPRSSASSDAAASDRWLPASLDLGIALTNSRQDQTYNTPAVGTLVLLAEQIRWMNESGGLDGASLESPILGTILRLGRVAGMGDAVRRRSGAALRRRRHHRPRRSISATALSAALRANGIVDTDSYRKLGRNQIRIGMFPAIDPDDVVALTACIDHLVQHAAGALAP